MPERSVEVTCDQTWIRVGLQGIFSVLRLDHSWHLDAIRCLLGQLQMDVRRPSSVFMRSSKVAYNIPLSNHVADLPPL